MKQLLNISRLLCAAFAIGAVPASAQNPIVQTMYSTDPAPMVSGDRLYVFTGHDEEKADFFWMNDWHVYSTADMVNWTDHGTAISQCDFAWADDRAWAPQCIERNGKFYLYVPIHSSISHGMAIGVAVADRPEGPYRDALGKPLYEDGKWDHIDPTAIIDDDGQAYIYWGNPRLYSAKLNEDMISFASEVKCDTTLKRYTEGPWIMKAPAIATKGKAKGKADKRASKTGKGKTSGSKYFMMYAAGGIPESIAYSESTNPQGPWTYVGDVMRQTNDTQSFTNHSGVATFRGHNYFFYHTGWLPGGGGFGRSICVEEFDWTPDGHFPDIVPTREGVKPIGTLDPFQKVEAETIAFSQGLHTEWNKKQGRVWVSDIHNGDWQKMREVEFKYSPASIEVVAASALQGGNIEVRLDSARGQLLTTVKIKPTGGWEEWETFSAPIKESVSGTHDLYFVYKGLKGCKLFNFDSWQMKSAPANFGFGGQQITAADMHYSEKIADINYADDGQAFHTMDLYLPENKSAKCPVVVHIYGSAWFSNSSKGTADLGTIVTALLKAGYAVACPNHRSSIDAAWPAQSHDIKAAVRYLRANAKQYGLDADHIAVSGFSSGGHLSSFMAATSGTKTAKVGNGEIDLEGNLGNYTKVSSKIYAAVDWSGPIVFPLRGDGTGSPEEVLLRLKDNDQPMFGSRANAFASLSPTTYLDPKDPPVIIFHGTADEVVPFDNGVKWAEAVSKAGLTSEFNRVENGGHGFNMYSEDNLSRMVKFLDKARGKK